MRHTKVVRIERGDQGQPILKRPGDTIAFVDQFQDNEEAVRKHIGSWAVVSITGASLDRKTTFFVVERYLDTSPNDVFLRFIQRMEKDGHEVDDVARLVTRAIVFKMAECEGWGDWIKNGVLYEVCLDRAKRIRSLPGPEGKVNNTRKQFIESLALANDAHILRMGGAM